MIASILKFIAPILKFTGTIAASLESSSCLMIFLDEPKMPKSLIK